MTHIWKKILTLLITLINFCTDTGPKMASKIERNEQDMVNKTGNMNMVNSIFLTPTCEMEVLNDIKTLSNTKSAGIDNMKAKSIKLIAPYTIKPLT